MLKYSPVKHALVLLLISLPAVVSSQESNADYLAGVNQYQLGNYKVARKSFGKACDDKVAEACRYLGLTYENAQGVEQDASQALKLYRTACDYKSAAGCASVGIMHYLGSGTAKDLVQARDWFGVACKLGNVYGCFALGAANHTGEGGPIDIDAAQMLYQRACEAGEGRACGNLGNMYKAGTGVKKNAVKAFELYTKACNLQVAPACYNLGDMYYKGEVVNRNHSKALLNYELACSASMPQGCVDSASMYVTGKGTARSQKMAHRLYNFSCQIGHAYGCFATAYIEEKEGKDVPARINYLKACSTGENEGCFGLGKMLSDGRGGAQDLAKAESNFLKACKAEVPESCLALAEIRDDERISFTKGEAAAQIFNERCEKDEIKACSGGLVSRMIRLGSGAISYDRFLREYLNEDFYTHLYVSLHDELSEDDQRELTQAVKLFVKSLLLDNTFGTIESMITNDQEENPFFTYYCSGRNTHLTIQEVNVKKVISALRSSRSNLLKTQRDLLDQNMENINTAQAVIRKYREKLKGVLQPQKVGSGSISESYWRNAKNDLRELAKVRDNRDSMIKFITQNLTENEASIVSYEKVVNAFERQQEQPCKLAEYQLTTLDGYKVTVAVIESKTNSMLANIEIPRMGITWRKFNEQYSDTENGGLIKPAAFIKGVFDYKQYEKK